MSGTCEGKSAFLEVGCGLWAYCGVYRVVLARDPRDGVHQVINRVHTLGAPNTSGEQASAGLTELTERQGQQAQVESWDRRILGYRDINNPESGHVMLPPQLADMMNWLPPASEGPLYTV